MESKHDSHKLQTEVKKKIPRRLLKELNCFIHEDKFFSLKLANNSFLFTPYVTVLRSVH
jgi:hypothetical protein